MVTAPFYNPYDLSARRTCECCEPRMTSYTATANVHKWTKQEIEDEIIELSKRLVKASWLERGDLRDRLKHWVEKLERYEQAKEEFK